MMDVVSRTAAVCEELLDITRRMHDAAMRDDWQAVSELESHRRGHLTALASIDAVREEIPVGRILPVLRQLVDLNKEIIERSIERKDNLAAQIHTMRRGRHAQSAYRMNSCA